MKIINNKSYRERSLHIILKKKKKISSLQRRKDIKLKGDLFLWKHKNNCHKIKHSPEKKKNKQTTDHCLFISY